MLGVSADHDSAELRLAYRTEVRRVHPDLNRSADATAATVALREAYELLAALLGSPRAEDTTEQQDPPTGPPPDVAPPAPAHRIAARLEADDTIALGASREEVGMALLDAAHLLGDLTYVDLGTGFLEVLVEFDGAPTSSLAMALQGRGNGEVEVFCSIEPLSGGEVPPIDAVTRLLLHTLQGGDPTQ